MCEPCPGSGVVLDDPAPRARCGQCGVDTSTEPAEPRGLRDRVRVIDHSRSGDDG